MAIIFKQLSKKEAINRILENGEGKNLFYGYKLPNYIGIRQLTSIGSLDSDYKSISVFDFNNVFEMVEEGD